MSTFTAIVHAENGKDWQRFEAPQRLIIASAAQQVIPALEEIDHLAGQGYTAVGYVSYEAASAFDDSLHTHEPDQPLLKFGIFSESSPWQPPAQPPSLALALAPELGKPDYDQAIAAIKNHLEAGNSYQVNFTQQLRGYCDADPLTVFTALLAAQPSRHAFFLQDEDEAICSVSPELFFHLQGDEIVMEPMKGTRPRTADSEQDSTLRNQLLSSEKERAENLMIVDMVRNDLGRIAERGSVEVTELFKILQLPTVWQQVSVVRARTSASLPQLFGSLFPCASITGAPKAQTMSIIHDLERGQRGIYTGALGVVRPRREMHFSVGIRSLRLDLHSRVASYGTGGGIVWDSEADAEWQETRDKARLLHSAATNWQLLETLAYEPETGIRYLEEHLARLANSARFFNILYDAKALNKLLNDYHCDDRQRLRLLLSQDGKFSLESQALELSDQTVRLTLARQPVHSSNVFLYHKTTERSLYERALADEHVGDDVILWNERDELTETTIYNLFLEFNGELRTPAIGCGLLPGTLRAHLLARGQCREAILKREDLLRADRILVGNSVRGLRVAEFTSD